MGLRDNAEMAVKRINGWTIGWTHNQVWIAIRLAKEGTRITNETGL